MEIKEKDTEKESEKDTSSPVYRQMLNASTVGMALVSGMLVGGVMGYFLDKWLNTSPWLLFIFLFFGLIAGIKNAIYYMKKAGIEVGSSSNNDENK